MEGLPVGPVPVKVQTGGVDVDVEVLRHGVDDAREGLRELGVLVLEVLRPVDHAAALGCEFVRLHVLGEAREQREVVLAAVKLGEVDGLALED